MGVSGGYVDRGEQVTTAAIREAREEAGLDIRIDHLMNVYSYPGPGARDHRLRATMIGGSSRAMTKGSRRSCFRRTTIPWDELAFQSTTEALREFLAQRPAEAGRLTLGDRDLLGEIHVLDRVEQRRAFLHRTLERLAARDQAHAAGALVDHRRLHRFLQIAFAR